MPEDDLSPELIKQGLGTRFVGRDIRYFPRLASTMDAGREAALDGAPEGTVILAGEQTAGRGRLKRSWLSPAGCLTFSVVLYPEERFLSFLVMAASLAVADTVELAGHVKAAIKWPNDVLVGDKKISGILVESGHGKDGTDYAVIGIGLNVNLNPAGCPEISDSATSLSMLTGRSLPRVKVMRQLLARIELWYGKLCRDEPVFAAWRGRLSTLGRHVRVQAGPAIYEGLAEDVAPDGELVLRLADGRVLKLPAGDVTLRV